MSAKTGLWSAFGALVGGAAGAMAGQAAVKYRPRVRYAAQSKGAEIEDAMVIGGAAGAVLGAFIGGAAGSDDPPPQLPPQR
jgi:hypothetical protein